MFTSALLCHGTTVASIVSKSGQRCRQTPLPDSHTSRIGARCKSRRSTSRKRALAQQTRIGASALTLGGLLKHPAAVEHYTFTTKLSGDPIGAPWDTTDSDESDDWEFSSAANDTPEQLYDLWDGAVERSRARLGAALTQGGVDQDTRHAGRRTCRRGPSRWMARRPVTPRQLTVVPANARPAPGSPRDQECRSTRSAS